MTLTELSEREKGPVRETSCITRDDATVLLCNALQRSEERRRRAANTLPSNKEHNNISSKRDGERERGGGEIKYGAGPV